MLRFEKMQEEICEEIETTETGPWRNIKAATEKGNIGANVELIPPHRKRYRLMKRMLSRNDRN